MKRVFLSLFIGVCLVLGYAVGTALVVTFLFDDDPVLFERLTTPINAPFAIADFLFPDRGEESFALGMFLGFGVNALIYGIPIYGILSALRVFGKSKKYSSGTEPPPPPTFDT